MPNITAQATYASTTVSKQISLPDSVPQGHDPYIKVQSDGYMPLTDILDTNMPMRVSFNQVPYVAVDGEIETFFRIEVNYSSLMSFQSTTNRTDCMYFLLYNRKSIITGNYDTQFITVYTTKTENLLPDHSPVTKIEKTYSGITTQKVFAESVDEEIYISSNGQIAYRSMIDVSRNSRTSDYIEMVYNSYDNNFTSSNSSKTLIASNLFQNTHTEDYLLSEELLTDYQIYWSNMHTNKELIGASYPLQFDYSECPAYFRIYNHHTHSSVIIIDENNLTSYKERTDVVYIGNYSNISTNTLTSLFTYDSITRTVTYTKFGFNGVNEMELRSAHGTSYLNVVNGVSSVEQSSEINTTTYNTIPDSLTQFLYYTSIYSSISTNESYTNDIHSITSDKFSIGGSHSSGSFHVFTSNGHATLTLGSSGDFKGTVATTVDNDYFITQLTKSLLLPRISYYEYHSKWVSSISYYYSNGERNETYVRSSSFNATTITGFGIDFDFKNSGYSIKTPNLVPYRKYYSISYDDYFKNTFGAYTSSATTENAIQTLYYTTYVKNYGTSTIHRTSSLNDFFEETFYNINESGTQSFEDANYTTYKTTSMSLPSYWINNNVGVYSQQYSSSYSRSYKTSIIIQDSASNKVYRDTTIRESFSKALCLYDVPKTKSYMVSEILSSTYKLFRPEYGVSYTTSTAYKRLTSGEIINTITSYIYDPLYGQLIRTLGYEIANCTFISQSRENIYNTYQREQITDEGMSTSVSNITSTIMYLPVNDLITSSTSNTYEEESNTITCEQYFETYEAFSVYHSSSTRKRYYSDSQYHSSYSVEEYHISTVLEINSNYKL